MKYVIYTLQFILKFIMIFFLVFIWARFFIKSLWLALFVSILITVLFDIVTRLFSKKKNKKQCLKIKDKEDAEDMFLSLTTSNYMLFFEKLVKSKHQNVTKKSKYLLIEHGDGRKVILYPNIAFKAITEDDITQILKNIIKEDANKIVLPCNFATKEAIIFAKNFEKEFIILDKFASYEKLYKPYNFYPEITLHYKKDKKMNFKQMLAFSFNKSRTKGYLFSAFILLLSTLFIRTNIYYCIMASILVIFAIISYANPYFNLKISNEVI